MKDHITLKRILLKLSGESLSNGQGFGIQSEACKDVARYLQEISRSGMELGVVIGGGNIFRGINLHLNGMSRTSADHMGMLATLMNGIALQQALAEIGTKARVLTALDCPKVAESYNRQHAMECLKAGEVVIFVGGTGNPYFTTDTAAALRACEIGANALLKATKVDGIYDKDPYKYSDAIKYSTMSYSQVLTERLVVMDATSVIMCQSNKIPIFVFNMKRLTEGNILSCLSDFSHGTLVT